MARASKALRHGLGGALAASLLLAARLGRGQPAPEPTLPVSFDIVSSDDCTAERFRAALAARVRRPFALRDGATTKLQVRVTRGSGGALAANASFEGASGSAQRSVRGSCNEITAALALVAATWLEAEPRIEAEPAPTPTPPVPAPPAPAPPAPAPPEAAAPAAPPPEAPTIAAPAAPAEARATAGTRASVVSPPRPYAVGGKGVASGGLVSGPAFGVAVSFAYEGARFELRAALAGALGTDTLTSSTAHYAWLTAPLDGCAHALSGRAVRLAGCVRVEPGYLRVQFADIAHSLPWLAVGAGVRLGWNAGPIRLEIEGFADLPVSGYRITREGTTFVPFRAAAGAFAAGFMVPFS